MSIPQISQGSSESHATTNTPSTNTQGVKRKDDDSEDDQRDSETARKDTASKPVFQRPNRRNPTVQEYAAPKETVPSTPKCLKSTKTKTKSAQDVEPDANIEEIYIDWNIHDLSRQPALTPQERAHFDKQIMPPPAIAASATPKRKRPTMHTAYYEEWNPPSPGSFLGAVRRRSLTEKYNTERAPWLSDPKEAVNGEFQVLKRAEPDEKWHTEPKSGDLSRAEKVPCGTAVRVAKPDTSLILKKDSLGSADLAGVPGDLVD